MLRQCGLVKGMVILLLMGGLVACREHAVSYEGYVDARYTQVAVPVSGQLQQLFVHRGQWVKKGAPLFALDPQPQMSEYQKAKAELNAVQFNLEDLKKGERPTEIAQILAQQKQVISKLALARKTYKRDYPLYKKGFISHERFDAVETSVTTLEAEHEELKQKLKTAQLSARSDEVKAAEEKVKAQTAAVKKLAWQIDQKAPSAPVKAQVFDTFYTVGEEVKENQPVVSLLDPTQVYIVVFVTAETLETLSKGQSAVLETGGKQYKGTVRYVSSDAEYTPPVLYTRDNMHQLLYRVEIAPQDADAMRFHPGAPVRITFELSHD